MVKRGIVRDGVNGEDSVVSLIPYFVELVYIVAFGTLCGVGGMAIVYSLVRLSEWCARMQLVKALRKEKGLSPVHPVRLDVVAFGPHFGSIREAVWAAIHCRYYFVKYERDDGSMESYALSGVFLPFLPWLRHMEMEPLSNDEA